MSKLAHTGLFAALLLGGACVSAGTILTDTLHDNRTASSTQTLHLKG